MSLAFKYRKSRLAEALYARSPRVVHNVIYSGYGYLKLREASAVYRDLVPTFEADERLPPETLRTLQVTLMRRVLVHAQDRCPYYKRVFAEAGVDARTMRLPDDLARLPILTKQDILEHYDDMRASNAEDYAPSQQSSGGTTGTTLNFLLDRNAYLAREAEVLTYWKRHGYEVGRDKAVMYRAGVIVPVDREIRDPWRTDHARKLLYLSSYYSSDDYFAQYAELLQRWQPRYMHALPSAAAQFAAWLIDQGVTIPLERVFSASEMLYPSQRDLLSRAFDCDVVEHYGHSEPGNYAAGTCSAGHLHTAPRNVFTEVTDEGDILETSLNNFSMPFIRYEIGDKSAGIHETPCPCGLTSPYFTAIEGRDSELIYSADGRTISSIGFDQIFRGNDVALGQIVQREVGKVILNVVPTQGFDEASRAKIIHALASRVGGDTAIELVLKDTIPLADNGKYRMVISEV